MDRLSLWSAAGLAAFLQPWTLVAAGATTVVEAKLATAGSYLALVFFCLLATGSFLYLELYATFASAERRRPAGPAAGLVDAHQDQVVVAVFLLLGILAGSESIYLLVT